MPPASGLCRVDVIGGQAVEFGCAGGRDGPEIGPDVPVEVLPDEHQLVAERLDALARRLVLVHAGEPEVAQRPPQVVPRFRVRGLGVETVQRVEHACG